MLEIQSKGSVIQVTNEEKQHGGLKNIVSESIVKLF
jgi:hypothetical protein